MSDVNESLSKFIEKCNQLIEAAFNEAAVQLPDVASQVLLFKGTIHGLFILFSLTGTYLFYQFYKWQVAEQKVKKERGERVDEVDAYVFIVLMITTAIPFIYNLSVLLKITLAPKMYLIEYTTSLINKV